MRCLDRQRQWVLVARYAGKAPAVDSQGRLMGKQVVSYTEQAPVLASVSSAKGQAQDSMFGIDLDYDKTVVIDDPTFEIDESSVLWIDKASTDADGNPEQCGEPFDYAVKRVSRTESYTVLAVKRVEVSR